LAAARKLSSRRLGFSLPKTAPTSGKGSALKASFHSDIKRKRLRCQQSRDSGEGKNRIEFHSFFFL
jgi:hypothetical protein